MSKRIEHIEKKWYAVKTKFRSEKYVCNLLEEEDVEAYIPLMKRTRRYQRKIKHYEVPLISTYVFVCVSQSDYVKVLKTLYVYGFVMVGGRLVAIPDAEIDLLKKVTGSTQEWSVVDSKELVEGDPIEIIGGSLTGVRGVMTSYKNKNEIVVELAHIGILLNLTVDKKYIRKLTKLEMAS